VATAIRCIHKPSGAVGYASDDKSQHRNKRKAFGRMARSKEFQEWVRIESARRTGKLAEMELRVERSMNDGNIRTEIRDNGRWTEIDISKLEKKQP